MMETEIVIIGGGAAGLMAAGRAAKSGRKVVLLEKNAKVGRKIGITGKGRCNCTNDCDTREFLENVVTNPRFLYASLAAFAPQDTRDLLEENGTPTKVERGKRVFPVSDRSFDVIDALLRYAKKSGARVLCDQEARSLTAERDGTFTVQTQEEAFHAKAVILCTGGLSYPSTGSTGDGFRFADQLGLTLVDMVPALIPLTTKESFCKELMGLSLKNVGVRYSLGKDGKTIYEDFGEMLFTHFGVTGPTVLSASSYLQRYLKQKHLNFEEADIHLHIDLKSALSEDVLDQRLLKDLEKYHQKILLTALEDLLPKRLIGVVLKEAGVDPRQTAAELKREERKKLVRVLKDLTLTITGTRPIEEATVTQGGVSVREVDPSSMMVKLIPGLFLCGEILDVDGVTGGFNLQIAFSTGYLAGMKAAEYIQ